MEPWPAMHTYYIAPDGAKIYYENHGDPADPTVFCIAGLFCGHNYWNLQIPTLLDMGYHVVTVALRGHGYSRKQHSTTALLQYCLEDINGLLEHVCPKDEYTWMGHSMGGAISLYYAIHYPERVKRLILLNTSYILEPSLVHILIWRGAEFAAITHDILPKITGTVFDIVAKSAAWLYRVPRSEAATITEEIKMFSGRTTVHELKELRKYDLGPKLGQIAVPTLLIAGNRDPLTPAYRSKIMARRIPNAEVHIVKGGHYPNILSSDCINRLLVAFLSYTDAAAAGELDPNASKNA